jgi:hypothetical protein
MLLIAIRVFQASKFEKAMLTASWFCGYFITPMTQFLATRTRHFKTMDISGMYMFAVSAILFVSIHVNSFPILLTLLIMAVMIFKQPAPLMADVYGQNYSSQERSSRLAFVLMMLPTSTMLFSPLGGKLMDRNLQNYRWILAMMAFAAIGSGLSFCKIPSRVLPPRTEKSIFSNFKIIFTDKLFGMMLFWWTISGVANQMTKPLRAEYLVNRDYGVNASNLVETLACATIPFGFRILSSLSWGKFFNRANVVTVKLLVNFFLMLGFWMFFSTRNKGIIFIASALIGIAYGGGEIIWCLWITKIAPKDKFSAYTSANVAVVGLRGFFAPFLGYFLSNYLTLQQISLIAVILVAISSIGFLSLINHPRFTITDES